MGKRNKSLKQSFGKALEKVENFIKSLSETSGTSANGEYSFFFGNEYGSLFLNEDDANHYKDCLYTLIDSFVTNQQMGNKAIEKLYQKAILSSLDINKKRNEPFGERLKQEIQYLRSALTEKPYECTVYYPVASQSVEGLPFEFGKVNFRSFSKEEAKMIIVNQVQKKLQSKERYDPIDESLNDVINKPLAITKVMACEREAAEVLAIKEIRLTIDVINFFADLIPYSKGYLFLSGDCEKEVITVLTTASNNGFWTSHQFVNPFRPFSMNKLKECDQKNTLGLSKVSQLLNVQRSDFQERLLSAIQWAGRATIAKRKEESFLLFAIALETLVLMDNDKDELSFRLRLRVSHIVESDLKSRQQLFDQLKCLYAIRSKIVHGGNYQVTDTDHWQMKVIAKRCILRILTDERCKNMKSVEDFVKWAENNMLK